MGRIEWASAARILGWVVGLSLFVGAIIRMALSLELFPLPEIPPGADFVDRIMTINEFQSSLWPLEFTSFVAFGIGFAALASLGPVVRRLARS